MSLLEEGIYSRLSGFAGLTALVSTRIYPVQIPQDADLPAVTYFRISGLRQYAFGNQTGIVNSRVQVSAWAESYSQVKAVAEQVRLALSNYHGTPGGVTVDWVEMLSQTDIFEDRVGELTGVYQVAAEFMISSRESLP